MPIVSNGLRKIGFFVIKEVRQGQSDGRYEYQVEDLSTGQVHKDWVQEKRLRRSEKDDHAKDVLTGSTGYHNIVGNASEQLSPWNISPTTSGGHDSAFRRQEISVRHNSVSEGSIQLRIPTTQEVDEMIQKLRISRDRIHSGDIEMIRGTEKPYTYGSFPSVPGMMATIRESTPDQPCIFSVVCDLRTFVREHYGDTLKSLAHMLALTGNCRDAQLTTVGSYFQQTWPDCSDILLSKLQAALDNACISGSEEVSLQTDNTSEDIHGRCEVTLGVAIRVEAAGTHQFVYSIGQQIAWLGAVCTASPGGLAYCNTRFNFDETSVEDNKPPQMNLTYQHAALDKDDQKLCWQRLLGNMVIVKDFPIPCRPKDIVGLQIPLEIMAELGRVLLVETFDSGIVLKGNPGAFDFYPIKKSGEYVQWHLTDSAESMLPYADDSQVPRLTSETFGIEKLGQSIICLGWTPKITNNVATKHIALSKIQPSKSDLAPKRTIALTSFGASVSKIIGFTIGFTIAETQFAPPIRSLSTYPKVLCDLAERNIILYDTATQRGWLVDAERAVYQILLHRAQGGQYGEDVMLEYLASEDNIRSIMELNGKKELGKPLNMESMANEAIYFAAEVGKIRDKLCEWAFAGQAEYLRINKDPCYQVGVVGFEYRNVVDVPEIATPLWQKLRNSSGGWPKIAHHQLCATILFAKGFQEIFLPSNTKSLCGLFHTAPSYSSFLAVETKQVQKLIASKSLAIHGCDYDSLYPRCTSSQDRPFNCNCKRVWDLHTGGTTPSRIQEELESTNGAIILGSWPYAPKPQFTTSTKKIWRVSELARTTNNIAPIWGVGNASSDDELNVDTERQGDS
ncbi:hypothetical protein J1614_010212 [Plenodomus biglobosus]|nr:hypothetical protein J1614_010212 [Plenodomus biglobosus]